jgi:hypothetical protein
VSDDRVPRMCVIEGGNSIAFDAVAVLSATSQVLCININTPRVMVTWRNKVAEGIGKLVAQELLSIMCFPCHECKSEIGFCKESSGSQWAKMSKILYSKSKVFARPRTGRCMPVVLIWPLPATRSRKPLNSTFLDASCFFLMTRADLPAQSKPQSAK